MKLQTTSALLALLLLPALAGAQSRWPAGDEIGMANNLGPATWARCAPHLANASAKSYELSFIRSNTMPQSPFAVPLRENAKPTVGIPGSIHAFNTDEMVSGDPGAARHANGCARAFRLRAVALGRQAPVHAAHRDVLRRCSARSR